MSDFSNPFEKGSKMASLAEINKHMHAKQLEASKTAASRDDAIKVAVAGALGVTPPQPEQARIQATPPPPAKPAAKKA
jgi:hypothetical protein